MSIVAEFTIPPDAIPGGVVFESMPDVRIELERVVPTHESIFPFFWVWGGESEAFLDAIADDPDLLEVRLLDELDDGALYRAYWATDSTIIQAIKGLQANILQARGTADGWLFQVRTADSEAFVAFQNTFESEGISVDLRKISSLTELVADRHYAITEKQREALTTAYEEGFYEPNRAISQAELGEKLGISGRAVSQRLRRGTGNLIATSLMTETDRE